MNGGRFRPTRLVAAAWLVAGATGCAGPRAADHAPPVPVGVPSPVAPAGAPDTDAPSLDSIIPPVAPAGYEAQPAPLPAPTPLPQAGLTVDQVVNGVLVSDSRLRAGFEAISQAHADALTASLRPNPTLYADIQMLPLTRPFTPDRTGGPPQQDVNLSYPIDWYLFGKRAANLAAAAQGVKVSEAEFADRVRRRVTDAVVGYYDVLEAAALLDLARQDVANLRRVEAALEGAVAAGGRPRVELDRVRLDRLRAEQAERDAGTALVTTKARLRAMMGRADADPDFAVGGSLDVPPAADPPPPEEGFALAVRDRPDVEAARRRTAQARATLEAERRKGYPDVAPLLGYTRQYQTKAVGQPDANSWTAAVSMTLPVTNRNQGNRARAASVVAQHELDYQAALADLRAEVVTAARELETARANVRAVAADQLGLARQVLDGVTTAYQAGGRTLVDFLDADRTFRDTTRAYITTRAAYWRAVTRYEAALGRQIAK